MGFSRVFGFRFFFFSGVVFIRCRVGVGWRRNEKVFEFVERCEV